MSERRWVAGPWTKRDGAWTREVFGPDGLPTSEPVASLAVAWREGEEVALAVAPGAAPATTHLHVDGAPLVFIDNWLLDAGWELNDGTGPVPTVGPNEPDVEADLARAEAARPRFGTEAPPRVLGPWTKTRNRGVVWWRVVWWRVVMDTPQVLGAYWVEGERVAKVRRIRDTQVSQESLYPPSAVTQDEIRDYLDEWLRDEGWTLAAGEVDAGVYDGGPFEGADEDQPAEEEEPSDSYHGWTPPVPPPSPLRPPGWWERKSLTSKRIDRHDFHPSVRSGLQALNSVHVEAWYDEDTSGGRLYASVTATLEPYGRSTLVGIYDGASELLTRSATGEITLHVGFHERAALACLRDWLASGQAARDLAEARGDASPSTPTARPLAWFLVRGIRNWIAQHD